MDGDMRIGSYDWAGGREAMLRFGPADGPQVIAAPPLFEEANRTRAAMIDVLRRLAGAGIGGALPDLPGTGESLVATVDARLTGWRAAFAAAAATSGQPCCVAWRSGVLVDASADVAGRWHLSPVDGATIVRELRRARRVAGGSDYAGNAVPTAMMDELTASSLPTGSVRTVRLIGDPRPADLHLAGAPMWRAIDPGTDPALQQAIADDIAAWVRSCAG